MAIRSDWHIHTHCSCDGACMEYEALINDAPKYGITDFGYIEQEVVYVRT